MAKYSAIVFDLDGVICHTDKHHYAAWKGIAHKLHIPFDETVNNRLRGVSRMESLDIILENYKGTLHQEQKEALAEEKNENYKKLLARVTPEDLAPVVKDTLDALRSAGVKLAIGSSSKNTKFILGQLGLEGFFDAIADGNDIMHSKPAPDIFLLAADRLGEKPANCLVVEDAAAGVTAAHAAGMDCAAIGDAVKTAKAEYNLESMANLLEIEGL